MTEQELNRLKQLLEKDKKDLEKELASLPLIEDMGSDTEGESYDEEADEAEQLINNAAARTSLEEKLRGINNALEKIENGAYGQCENCRKEIDKKLLENNPSSSICRNCE